ncbi:hypothetical protein AAIA72_16210 [Hahella sp. SMD15-11]|uniref:Uncharacterized protein n=1 Tax=Thermohahella caldifontis TaxID=3142973 RepID=A0AB39UWH7_9GAMM
MTWASFLFLVTVVSLILWGIAQAYDYIQIWRGVFPPPDKTTLDDIRRLRDRGHTGIAVKRFLQRPENKGRYTQKGAEEAVRNL